MFEHCKQFDAEYPMSAVDEIPGLNETLVRLSTDYHTWVSIYECSACGQPWEQSFTSRGHSDVPSVRKLTGVEANDESGAASALSSQPPVFPSEMAVTALLDDQPMGKAWLVVELEMDHKNDYGLLFGPTDASGKLVIKDMDLRQQAKKQLDLFPMDYVSPEGAWTGAMKIRVLNRTDVVNLQNAYETWKDAGLYPADFPLHLSRLQAQLEANRDRRLSARVHIPESEAVQIQVVDQLA